MNIYLKTENKVKIM